MHNYISIYRIKQKQNATKTRSETPQNTETEYHKKQKFVSYLINYVYIYGQIYYSYESLLLKGETPRLIDEWQVAPVLWDAVRTAVDTRNEVGQFILTGSNSVEKSAIMHSGTGRIARMQMYLTY